MNINYMPGVMKRLSFSNIHNGYTDNGVYKTNGPKNLKQAVLDFQIQNLSKLIKRLANGVMIGDILASDRQEVLAFTQDELKGLLKFSTLAVYSLHNDNIPSIKAGKIDAWYDDAEKVLKEAKLSTAHLKAMYGFLKVPGKLSEAKSEKLQELAIKTRNAMRGNDKAITSHSASNNDLFAYITKIYTYFNSASDNSYKYIMSKVALLGDTELSKIMLPEIKLNAKAVNEYRKFIREKTKRDTSEYLPKETLEKLAPKEKKTHDDLKKAADASYKEALQHIVRTSGKPHLPAVHLKMQLKSQDFPTWKIPAGFEGHVDESGKLYTKEGKQLAGGQLGGTMTMNPDYDPEIGSMYYAKGRGIFSKTDQQYYTMDHKKGGRNSKKDEHADDLEENFADYSSKWRKDMTRKSDPLKQQLGAMCEMLYNSQARPGNPSAKSGDEPTYGLTTWLVKHVSINNAGNLIVNYEPGKNKAKIRVKHVIKPNDVNTTYLINYVKGLIAGKKQSDPLWTIKGRRTTQGDLNKYLKSLGFGGSAKHFRLLKGNTVFKKMIAEKPLKKNATQKEAEDYHNKIAEAVGNHLGHVRTKDGVATTTGATARTSYISPSLQAELFRSRGLRLPRWLESVHKEEEAE